MFVLGDSEWDLVSSCNVSINIFWFLIMPAMLISKWIFSYFIQIYATAHNTVFHLYLHMTCSDVTAIVPAVWCGMTPPPSSFLCSTHDISPIHLFCSHRSLLSPCHSAKICWRFPLFKFFPRTLPELLSVLHHFPMYKNCLWFGFLPFPSFYWFWCWDDALVVSCVGVFSLTRCKVIFVGILLFFYDVSYHFLFENNLCTSLQVWAIWLVGSVSVHL